MVFYNCPEYCHSSAASFLGDGLSSAGKLASTFLVILPLEEETESYNESLFNSINMFISVLFTYKKNLLNIFS